MAKQLRVRGEFYWKFKDFFVTELLSSLRGIKRTEKNPDLTIALVEPTPLTMDFINSPKKLLVSGENLFHKINLFKINEYITKKTGIKFSALNKVLPKFILDMKLGIMRRQYLNYVVNLSKNSPQGEYAIIQNDIRGENILNLPFFLQVKNIRDNLNKLTGKKIGSRKNKKFCCIVISNESSFDRIEFFKELSKYKKVDCFGKTSYTNADNNLLPKCWSENASFFSDYKFVISFENCIESENITEKLPNAMLGGSIPIYKGAPNIGDYFNRKSFINWADCGKSYSKMIKKIIELDQDDKKYLGFLGRPWVTPENKNKIENKERELRVFLRKIVSD